MCGICEYVFGDQRLKSGVSLNSLFAKSVSLTEHRGINAAKQPPALGSPVSASHIVIRHRLPNSLTVLCGCWCFEFRSAYLNYLLSFLLTLQ